MSLVQKQATRPCPITGDRTVVVLHHQQFVLAQDNPLPSAYDVVWSPRGGFAYADTPAEQVVYDQYYAGRSKYEDNVTSTGGGASPSDLVRIEQTAADIAKLFPNRRAKIVDIGCANGGLLQALKNLGYDSLLGVDPSPSCVESVRAVPGIDATVGGILTLPRLADGAEMVLLSHVLEHIYDLRRAVRAVANALASKGILYVEVPDAARYRDFIVAPFQDFNTEHINHFSLVSLRNLFQSQGFEFISAGTRTVDSTPGCPYPVLFALFRKSAKPVVGFDYRRDNEFLESIQEYVVRSRAKLRLMESRINQWSRSRAPIIVWGTGELTMKLLAETSLRDANIVAFVDGNPVNQGKTLVGREIYAPRELQQRFGESPSILVATLLHQQAIARIIREDLKLSNQIIGLN